MKRKNICKEALNAIVAISIVTLIHLSLPEPMHKLIELLASTINSQTATTLTTIQWVLAVIMVSLIFIGFRKNRTRLLNMLKATEEIGPFLSRIWKGAKFASRANTFSHLADTWTSTLNNPDVEANRKLLEAYLNAYLLQESKDVRYGRYEVPPV